MREYSQRGLSDLNCICIFEEEGIPRVGGAPRIRLTKKHKNRQIRKFASRKNLT